MQPLITIIFAAQTRLIVTSIHQSGALLQHMANTGKLLCPRGHCNTVPAQTMIMKSRINLMTTHGEEKALFSLVTFSAFDQEQNTAVQYRSSFEGKNAI